MANPYLEAALRAQDAERPKSAPKTSEAKSSTKAASSAEKSDTTAPSKEK